MNIELSHTELEYVASKMAFDSWQSSIAKSVENKCRAAIPAAKKHEDAANLAARISTLKTELAALEKEYERQTK